MIKDFNMTDGGKGLIKLGMVLYLAGFYCLLEGNFMAGMAKVLREVENNIDKGGFTFSSNGKTKQAYIVSDRDRGGAR